MKRTTTARASRKGERKAAASPNGARPAKGGEAGSGLRKARGAWKGTHDPDELIRTIYADRLKPSRSLPEL